MTDPQEFHKKLAAIGLVQCVECGDSGVVPTLLDSEGRAVWAVPCQKCDGGCKTALALCWQYRKALTTLWLRSIPYRDYLQTKEWQECRAKALERADRRCQLCNFDKVLEVHHRVYNRIGEELDTDLIVLCRECHARFHDKLP